MKTSVSKPCLFIALLFNVVASSAQHWMTNKEVFDFKQGDVFERYYVIGQSPAGHERDSVASRGYSSNGDTLIYNMHVTMLYFVNYSHVTRSMHEEVWKYYHLDSLIMKGEHIDHRNFHDTTKLETNMDSMWTDTSMKRVVNQHYWQNNNHFEPAGQTDIYASGLGEIQQYQFDDSGPFGAYWIMYYFKKGNETWGKHNMFDGINEQESNQDQIKIYPVPVRRGESVTLANISKGNVRLIIMDMSGRMLSAAQYYSEGTIRVQLDGVNQPGIYLLKLVSGSEVFTSKLVIEDAH